LFMQFGDYRGFLGLLHVMLDQAKLRWKVLDDSQGLGTANTALAFHAGRLLALHEGDAPYWVKVACNGLVSTIQRFTFNGRLEHSFTAHPKIDPVTGELFAFGYSVERAPYCWLYRCDPNGALVSTVEVPLPAPIMMHDFALTERYVIFMDVPLLFQPDAMLKKGTLPFVYEKTRPARFGVLDRYATDSSGIKWFTTDPCMVFHVANAWETDPSGTRIELYVCAFNDFSLDAFTAVSPDSEPHLTRITLDMTSGEATMLRLSPIPGDFPVVPATLVGRRTRYSYVAAFETSPYGSPLFYGVTKVDLAAPGPQAAVVGVLEHGAGRLGGEAYFVPKEGGTDEDDGYLMTYVFDGAKDCSELVVYDAKTMSSTPVARVLLPQRVPHGFHCTWVTEEQLAAQRKA